MKLVLSLISTTLVTTIALTACTSSTETSPGNTDTATTTTEVTNTADETQQKLEANKKLVADFCQGLYGDKDSAAIDKYVADDVIEHNPLLKDGKEWLKNELRPFLVMPGIKKTKVDIDMMAAEGDKVWVLIKDVAPNGKVWARVNVFRIDNGKIAEVWKVSEAVAREDVGQVF